MNSALGPLIRRLGLIPNRRVNRPKKTPATRPASIGKKEGKAEDCTSNRRSATGDTEKREEVLRDFEEAINPCMHAVYARRLCRKLSVATMAGSSDRSSSLARHAFAGVRAVYSQLNAPPV
jgi:hypothetical protein